MTAIGAQSSRNAETNTLHRAGIVTFFAQRTGCAQRVAKEAATNEVAIADPWLGFGCELEPGEDEDERLEDGPAAASRAKVRRESGA